MKTSTNMPFNGVMSSTAMKAYQNQLCVSDTNPLSSFNRKECNPNQTHILFCKPKYSNRGIIWWNSNSYQGVIPKSCTTCYPHQGNLEYLKEFNFTVIYDCNFYFFCSLQKLFKKKSNKVSFIIFCELLGKKRNLK